AALEFENGRIAQEIHIRGDGREQDRLLSGAQRLAGGEHLAFGLPRAIAGLEAVVERLGPSDTVVSQGLIAGRHKGTRARDCDPRGNFKVLLGNAAGGGEPWTIAAERDRHALIGYAGGSALGVELRIIAVGLDEGA